MFTVISANRKNLFMSVALCCLPCAVLGMEDDGGGEGSTPSVKVKSETSSVGKRPTCTFLKPFRQGNTSPPTKNSPPSSLSNTEGEYPSTVSQIEQNTKLSEVNITEEPSPLNDSHNDLLGTSWQSSSRASLFEKETLEQKNHHLNESLEIRTEEEHQQNFSTNDDFNINLETLNFLEKSLSSLPIDLEVDDDSQTRQDRPSSKRPSSPRSEKSSRKSGKKLNSNKGDVNENPTNSSLSLEKALSELKFDSFLDDLFNETENFNESENAIDAQKDTSSPSSSDLQSPSSLLSQQINGPFANPSPSTIVPLSVKQEKLAISADHDFFLCQPSPRQFMSKTNAYTTPQDLALLNHNGFNHHGPSEKKTIYYDIRKKFVEMQTYCQKSCKPLDSLRLRFYIEITGETGITTEIPQSKESMDGIKPEDLLSVFWRCANEKNLFSHKELVKVDPSTLELLAASVLFLMRNMDKMDITKEPMSNYRQQLSKTFSDCCEELSKRYPLHIAYSFNLAKHLTSLEFYEKAWLHIVKITDSLSKYIDTNYISYRLRFIENTNDLQQIEKGEIGIYSKDNELYFKICHKESIQVNKSHYFSESADDKEHLAKILTKLKLTSESIMEEHYDLLSTVHSLPPTPDITVLDKEKLLQSVPEGYLDNDYKEVLKWIKNLITMRFSYVMNPQNRQGSLAKANDCVAIARLVETVNIIENNKSEFPESVELIDLKAADIYLESALYTYKSILEGDRLQLLCGPEKQNELVKIKKGKLLLFSEENRVYGKISEKEKIEIIKFDDPAAVDGYALDSFERILKMLKNPGESPKKVASLDRERLLCYMLSRDYISSKPIFHRMKTWNPHMLFYLAEIAEDQAFGKKINKDPDNFKNYPKNRDLLLQISKNFYQIVLEIYEKEAAKDVNKQHTLAWMYESGLGVLKNENEAARLYKIGAEKGHGESQASYGIMCEDGRGGVPQSYEQAAYWYGEASSLEIPDAQYNLGYLYEAGLGVPQNYGMALEYYKLSADQGYEMAQLRLGQFYEEGREGIPADHFQAEKYYKLAADQGNPEAQFKLSILYRGKFAVEENPFLAFKYCRLAAEQGHIDALLDFGWMYLEGYGVAVDVLVGLSYYKILAEQKNPEANLRLGMLYEEGELVEKNYLMAYTYYLSSAKQNDANAHYNLGRMYQEGFGIKPDPDEAFNYYKNAAALGHEDAQVILNKITDGTEGT